MQIKRNELIGNPVGLDYWSKPNLSEDHIGRKQESARLNVEFASILIATISISFGLSNLSSLFQSTKLVTVIFLGGALVFLVIAIATEADAVYYYSRGKGSDGDYFDSHGYQLIKIGLLFSLITVLYLASALVPPVILLPDPWAQISQGTLPMVIGLIPFLSWRVFKVRRLGHKWYKVW
jgi:hypothetical protein